MRGHCALADAKNIGPKCEWVFAINMPNQAEKRRADEATRRAEQQLAAEGEEAARLRRQLDEAAAKYSSREERKDEYYRERSAAAVQRRSTVTLFDGKLLSQVRVQRRAPPSGRARGCSLGHPRDCWDWRERWSGTAGVRVCAPRGHVCARQ